MKFLVDDTGEIDWKADLVPSGSVWVKFTPAQNADATVIASGIRMKATITLQGTQNKFNEETLPPSINIPKSY
mgnify:CR=1 FL=1